jgi:hypothetical protein
MESSKRDYLFADVTPDIRACLKLDSVALFSVTPSWMTKIIATVLLKKFGAQSRITDGTACVGGDTMAFARVFAHVTAVEANAERAAMCAANVAAIGLSHKVTVLHANYVDVTTDLSQDVVFLDAPWGGPDYWRAEKLDLFLEHGGTPTPLVEICAKVWPHTRGIALKLPINFNADEFLPTFGTLIGCECHVQWTNMRKALLLVLSK